MADSSSLFSARNSRWITLCASCLWWKGHTVTELTTEYQPLGPRVSTTGECHESPARLIPVNIQGVFQVESMWPVTAASDFCGKAIEK